MWFLWNLYQSYLSTCENQFLSETVFENAAAFSKYSAVEVKQLGKIKLCQAPLIGTIDWQTSLCSLAIQLAKGLESVFRELLVRACDGNAHVKNRWIQPVVANRIMNNEHR